MFDKLEDLLVRFEEVLNELGEPGVTDNQERFQKLMKEQSELQPIVDAYKEYKDNKDMIIGVGSVLNGKMAKDSILAGAKYVVSPGYNEEINDVCHEMGVTYFPGCMTVTEIMHALEKGNKMVKVFPGEIFGPKYIKAVKAPIPHVEIMPTGGVNIDNIEEWFKMGVSCVGVGGALFKGSLEDIENLAKEFVNKIEKIRS